VTVEPAVREAVFTAPTTHKDRERMRRAHAATAGQFQVSAAGPKMQCCRPVPFPGTGDCRLPVKPLCHSCEAGLAGPGRRMAS
jgi:hypothetical protein